MAVTGMTSSNLENASTTMSRMIQPSEVNVQSRPRAPQILPGMGGSVWHLRAIMLAGLAGVDPIFDRLVDSWPPHVVSSQGLPADDPRMAIMQPFQDLLPLLWGDHDTASPEQAPVMVGGF